MVSKSLRADKGKKGGEYIDLVSKTVFTALIIAEHPQSRRCN